MGEMTEAQKRAHKAYIGKFARVEIRMTPERRDAIQAHAQAMGESATTFINRAIDNQILQDGPESRPGAAGAPQGRGVVSFSMRP